MNSNKKKTDDIYTYLKFRGDLDLKNYPLNEVDALIFSELSYEFSNSISVTLKSWLAKADYEDRKVMVNALFDVLEIGGIRDVLDFKNISVQNATAMFKAASNLPKGQREIIGNLIKMWMTESRKTVVNAIKSEESSWEIPEFNIRKKSEF